MKIKWNLKKKADPRVASSQCFFTQDSSFITRNVRSWKQQLFNKTAWNKPETITRSAK